MKNIVDRIQYVLSYPWIIIATFVYALKNKEAVMARSVRYKALGESGAFVSMMEEAIEYVDRSWFKKCWLISESSIDILKGELEKWKSR